MFMQKIFAIIIDILYCSIFAIIILLAGIFLSIVCLIKVQNKYNKVLKHGNGIKIEL